MSTLPNFDNLTTMRRFLQTQSVDFICRDMMPSLLAELRRLPAPGDVGDFLDSILLAHADHLMIQDSTVPQSDDHLPPVTRDAFLKRFKPKSSTQVLCGYLFQRNDIVFNCKTCQSDETCVLCLKCFQNGNHEGHDVFFHRTSPGGVCDCGDSEAWAPEGFCDIVRVADALFTTIVEFCVEMAKRSMQGRQTLHELRLEVQERGFTMEDAQRMERQFHVRICNDDVHSDEDLIRSLSQKRIPRAEDLVRAIDSNGSEIVARNLTLRDALTLMQALKSEGWHVCVVQDRFIHNEDVLLRVTQWQLHVLFCDKLFATNGQSKEPIQVMFLSDPYFRKDIVLELYELYLKLQGDKDPKLQFSIVFLKVYNRMMLKYFCGVGTREESLFQYGVQILTTPSIHQGVYHTLDCDHPLLKFKRYHFVIENFGYVLGIPAMSSALLLRSDLLEKWLDALAEFKGWTPAHVTYETQSWLTAFAFHANVSKILTFISKGLRYHEAVDTDTRNRDRERMVLNMLEGFWDQLDRAG
ncbi:Zinc finger, UBR-type [Phytophthora cactorum]|nr:Zinc finger, UBR-type [Phytophthora cactorum]